MRANMLPALNTPRFGVVDDFNFNSARQEIDHWFERFFDRGNGGSAPSGWYAPVAVWEDDNHWYLEAELPGVSQDNLELTVLKGQLHMVADRPAPQLGDRRYWHNERRYGRFERVIYLPEAVDADSIKAELHDGILSVELSKRPEAQPRRISVEAR